MLYANKHSHSNIFILDLISTPHRWNQTQRQKNHFTIWLSFYFSSFLPFASLTSRGSDELCVGRRVDWIVKISISILLLPKSENNEQAEKNARKNDKNFNAFLSRRRQIKKFVPAEHISRSQLEKKRDSNQFWWDTTHNTARSALYRFVKHNQKQMCWTLWWWLERTKRR